MKGGIIHGVGMKGKVMDYGAIESDVDSLENIQFHQVDHIDLYVLKNSTIQKETKDPSILYDIIHHDKEHNYVVKEFMEPSILMKTQGMTKHTYMMREIDGFSHILPLLKKHNIAGIKYRNTVLFGFEIFMKQSGNLYDSTISRCFVINRKCQETMSMKKVDLLKPNQFIAFVKHILSELVELQKLNMAHGDIKLDNIMKCNGKFELIDWENSRKLDYDFLVKQRYLGLSPMYFKILYGSAWYHAFSTALLKYYQETGGYDTYTSSKYADSVNSHYTALFSKHTTEEVFQQVKYELDLTAFGFILYGIMVRNPTLKKYNHFIMNLFKMKNASIALHEFSKLNKTRRV
jgi:serine/threonine protein kinase